MMTCNGSCTGWHAAISISTSRRRRSSSSSGGDNCRGCGSCSESAAAPAFWHFIAPISICLSGELGICILHGRAQQWHADTNTGWRCSKGYGVVYMGLKGHGERTAEEEGISSHAGAKQGK